MQVIIFDLELSGPVSRISLPAKFAPFYHMLQVMSGCFHMGSTEGDGQPCGVDLLLAVHTVSAHLVLTISLFLWACIAVF